MPLPPYIKRTSRDSRKGLDKERYQTIFSRELGAIASPTAGLHFTDSLVKNLKKARIQIIEVTLHVGYGTFQPVRSADIREHKLGEEEFHISRETALAVNRAKKEGRRVIAVGTTVVRTLESAFSDKCGICQGRGKTDLMITPGYRFRVIDGMITNFHLPGSSLLFLVSAFAGLELLRKAYGWAIEKRYRFYSYGDAMLVL
jgi:S-adenosylmethionine:tRNA ribosyltransferase-isomerase